MRVQFDDWGVVAWGAADSAEADKGVWRSRERRVRSGRPSVYSPYGGAQIWLLSGAQWLLPVCGNL